MKTPEEKRIASQWPKNCSCGIVYTNKHLPPGYMGKQKEWTSLPVAKTVNAPNGQFKDVFGRFEMRNCFCGSTLMVILEIYDLSAE